MEVQRHAADEDVVNPFARQGLQQVKKPLEVHRLTPSLTSVPRKARDLETIVCRTASTP